MTYKKQQMTDKKSVFSISEYKKTKYHTNNSSFQTRLKKQDQTIYSACNNNLQIQLYKKFKSKIIRIINADCKKPRLPILKSHKTDFKTINITRKRDIS